MVQCAEGQLVHHTEQEIMFFGVFTLSTRVFRLTAVRVSPALEYIALVSESVVDLEVDRAFIAKYAHQNTAEAVSPKLSQRIKPCLNWCKYCFIWKR